MVVPKADIQRRTENLLEVLDSGQTDADKLIIDYSVGYAQESLPLPRWLSFTVRQGSFSSTEPFGWGIDPREFTRSSALFSTILTQTWHNHLPSHHTSWKLWHVYARRVGIINQGRTGR